MELIRKMGRFGFQFSIFVLALVSCTNQRTQSFDKQPPVLVKSTNAAVTSSINTVFPASNVTHSTVKANGVITYDTRRSATIPIRFSGRIEKLSVRYNFQAVQKGQKIMEIYSPELLTAQRDLLYLLSSDKDNVELINSSKQKLKLLGVLDAQVAQLIKTRKEFYSFSIYSPVDGYVVDAGIVSDVSPTSAARNEFSIREGMYVASGQSILSVVNTDRVWAEFDVYQRDAGSIKINDPVKLTFNDLNQRVDTKVDVIIPYLKAGESFVKIRCYIDNKSKLSIGQLFTATVNTLSGNALWIPLSARMDLGASEIAFVKRRGVFRPTAIVTANQSGDWIEVVNGLESTDSVAYNAQFMVDSDSFIKVKK